MAKTSGIYAETAYRRAMFCPKFSVSLSIFCLIAATAFSAEISSSVDPREGWKLAARTKEVAIYSRLHPGSPLKEFKAVGTIEAPTRAVFAVIDDFENYPKFMPCTTECRVIKRDADSRIGYQRLSPKICADRDYTLRAWNKSWATATGLAFMTQWVQANEFGPPEKKGVVRINVCDGGWLLEPDGPARTRATYAIFTDTGGLIPAFIANQASRTGITRLFAAVRKQVKDPKYAAADLAK